MDSSFIITATRTDKELTVVMHYCIPTKRKEEKKHPIQLESTGWKLEASDNWDSPYRLEKIFSIFFLIWND
jgi:hypothetical protein